MNLPDSADRARRRESHNPYGYEIRVASRVAEKRRLVSVKAWAVLWGVVFVAVGYEVLHPLVLR